MLEKKNYYCVPPNNDRRRFDVELVNTVIRQETHHGDEIANVNFLR